MKILELKVKNYRTLKDISLEFDSSYCTISGQNNAGKSCLIRLLMNLFRGTASRRWISPSVGFSYDDDKTLWEKGSDPIEIQYLLEFSQTDDPALLSFVSKILQHNVATNPSRVSIKYLATNDGQVSIEVSVDGYTADTQTSRDIASKIGESNLMFLYNSTVRQEDFYYGPGNKFRSLYEVILSEDDKKQLNEAAKQTERKLNKLARKNREELNSILGRLSDKYDVEFSPLDGFATRHMPFGINLKDKSVEVPLSDWGSGTQNRTHILMTVLQANRIKTTESSDDKITPIVVVEEPESFLHPSAQAEFGKLLRTLATELGIQVFVTTHSPYMLNPEVPSSNILLSRTTNSRKALETVRVDTSGENWMAPFSEHLGLSLSEFNDWRPLFSSETTKVLLVEGPIDQEYFEYLQANDVGIERLRGDIEVVPYGGKDTLKNTLLLSFVLRKFDNVFVTYDLDCKEESTKALGRVGLVEKKDHLALGINQAGRNAIEGLLPNSVLSAVNGQETDLVMQLGSQKPDERRKAKEQLKKKYLAEFKSIGSFQRVELNELDLVIRAINKAFNRLSS